MVEKNETLLTYLGVIWLRNIAIISCIHFGRAHIKHLEKGGLQKINLFFFFYYHSDKICYWFKGQHQTHVTALW